MIKQTAPLQWSKLAWIIAEAAAVATLIWVAVAIS